MRNCASITTVPHEGAQGDEGGDSMLDHIGSAPNPAAQRTLPGRISQLDGLRGVAAFVVVVHHSLLVAPELARAYGVGRSDLTGWSWWLTHTPLHLLWDGPAAVFLFFVLSGFVLTLPFLGSRAPRWRDYYPRRLARLYLPVWGAVAFAVILVLLVPRVSRPAQSWWVNLHAFHLGWSAIATDAALVFGNTALNTPLWSLQWEVIFSLLLPLYLLVAVWLRRWWWLLLGLIFLTVQLRANAYAFYLPMFGIGAVMAVRRDVLDPIAGWLPRWAWPGLMLVSLLLINAKWYPVRIPGETLLTLAGVALMVFIFFGWGAMKRLGDARVVQWLGKRSFSLYLVHEPIVVSVAMATATTNPLLVLAISAPVSLLVAAAFYRVVEYPAHLLSKKISLPQRRMEAAEPGHARAS